MSAITRGRPPQWGHEVISSSNTRFYRCAQVSGAVGGSVRSVCGASGFRDRLALAGSLGFRRCRRTAGVSTIAGRRGELGAKTPWYRVRLTRGRGTSSPGRSVAWRTERTALKRCTLHAPPVSVLEDAGCGLTEPQPLGADS